MKRNLTIAVNQYEKNHENKQKHYGNHNNVNHTWTNLDNSVIQHGQILTIA